MTSLSLAFFFLSIPHYRAEIIEPQAKASRFPLWTNWGNRPGKNWLSVSHRDKQKENASGLATRALVGEATPTS